MARAMARVAVVAAAAVAVEAVVATARTKEANRLKPPTANAPWIDRNPNRSLTGNPTANRIAPAVAAPEVAAAEATGLAAKAAAAVVQVRVGAIRAQTPSRAPSPNPSQGPHP